MVLPGTNSPRDVKSLVPVEAQNSSLLNREKGPLFHKPHGRRLHVEDTSRVHR
jgi:hypothetical protein